MTRVLLPALLAVGVVACAPAQAEDVMLQDFDALTPAQLAEVVSVHGDNLSVALTRTDERAGVQNLLLTAELDPAKPNWNHIRLRFPVRVRQPETLTFWYRGDKVARLYIIVEDSSGVRTDATVGGQALPNQWHQASLRLKDMHVPNADPPNDRATPQDVAALEVFPYPADYPGRGVYQFQLDDISVTRPDRLSAEVSIDDLSAPVRNPGFEEVTADGAGFVGWSFHISREARVSMGVSRQERRSGKLAAWFRDESAVSPHVYGRFLQRVPVQPNTAYRLSCWCKGQGVRNGSHWTDWKSYMLRIPAGDYDWQRVETSFVTGQDQTVLELGLNVVNLTDNLWVDDVELTPDLTVVPADVPGGRLALWCPAEVVADREEVPVKVMWQSLPADGGTMRVAVLQEDEEVAATEREWTSATGVVELFLRPQSRPRQEHRVVARFMDGRGAALGEVSRDMNLFSALLVKDRLAGVADKLQRLEQEMAGWTARGLPVDYPLVTKTVAENFIPWIEEDIAQGEVRRALQQTTELHEVLDAAIIQCQNPPPIAALTVPRYHTGEIRIEGGHFTAQVRWPDGRVEHRPVFFNGYGHFGSVRRDLEKLPAYGLNILQVEFGPNSVVQRDFAIDLAACHDFEALLDRAEKANVTVNLLLSPHYFPQWARERWPELNGINGGFNSFDIDHPRAREVEEAFLRAIVPRLRGRSGLHSLCLSNEPIYIDARSSAYNQAKWVQWLQARYGDIATLNALYGTRYASFDEVPSHNGDAVEATPAFYDWICFNNERFASWHRWMADIIHELAPEIPVHAKIMNLPFARHTIGWGNDPELFCDLSQIAGNDNYNYFVHDDGEIWGNGWQWANQFIDLLRSMRGQPSFNSENHVVADRNWAPVPGMHMRNLIWQAAIHGQGASTMWVWERTYDNRSDFAGSVMHRPALCDAHGRAALDLMRLAPEVVAIQDAPARVAIIYSICALLWNPEYAGDVAGIYQALTFLGEKVDFITYRQLAAGQGARYPVIIAPGVTAFEEEGYRALEALSHQSGHRVITVRDDCLTRDQYGRPRDISGLGAVRMDMLDAKDARRRLQEALGLDFPVQVLDADSGQLAWGVGWRWAHDGGRWLVNLCNYTRKPVRLRLVTPGQQPVDLMRQAPVDDVIELQGMEPLLVAAPDR